MLLVPLPRHLQKYRKIIEDGSGVHEFTDFDENKTDLTNFDMTTITIEYRVMDGWGNKSEII